MYSNVVYRRAVRVTSEAPDRPEVLLHCVVWLRGSEFGVVAFDHERRDAYTAEPSEMKQGSFVDSYYAMDVVDRSYGIFAMLSHDVIYDELEPFNDDDDPLLLAAAVKEEQERLDREAAEIAAQMEQLEEEFQMEYDDDDDNMGAGDGDGDDGGLGYDDDGNMVFAAEEEEEEFALPEEEPEPEPMPPPPHHFLMPRGRIFFKDNNAMRGRPRSRAKTPKKRTSAPTGEMDEADFDDIDFGGDY